MQQTRGKYRMVLNEDHYGLYRETYNSYGEKEYSDIIWWGNLLGQCKFKDRDQRTTLG
jgi:hypothetical protein